MIRKILQVFRRRLDIDLDGFPGDGSWLDAHLREGTAEAGGYAAVHGFPQSRAAAWSITSRGHSGRAGSDSRAQGVAPRARIRMAAERRSGSDPEMYRVFNCGIGMTIQVAAKMRPGARSC